MLKCVGILVAAILLLGATPPPKTVGRPNQPTVTQARQPASPDRHPEGFWERVRTDPVAAFTLVLAGFTGVLTVATVLLWLETKTAINDGRKSSERELRAYVMVTLKGATMPRGRDGQASVEIHNRGQTPAKKVCVKWAVYVGDLTISNEEVDRLNAATSNPENSEMVLGPDEHRGANIVVKPFDEEEIISVRVKGAYLYVAGSVEYVDAFHCPRSTRFLHRYQGEDLSGDAGTYGHYGNSYT